MLNANKINSVSLEKHMHLSKKMQLTLASLRLEGIELPSDALNDLHLFDAGKISKKELLERAIARAKT